MILPLIALASLIGAPARFGVAQFSYRSPAFSAFVADSYHVYSRPNPREFYDWFEKATLPTLPNGLVASLTAKHEELAGISNPERRATMERSFAERMHRLVKKSIPKFSLDRGFEFVHTVSRGERQCFLQSVLVASLLQRAGMDAGVAMIWRNIADQESNNGHAVTVTQLSNGRYLIVDCSEPMAFPRHRGLFLPTTQGYRFTRPVFNGETPDILAFEATDGKPVTPRGLGIPFLNSQFDYYRGERAEGGFMAAPKTEAGLARSAMFLEKATRECPENPLAQYVLGHVYLRQGKTSAAKQQYRSALDLYRREGWVPTPVATAAR